MSSTSDISKINVDELKRSLYDEMAQNIIGWFIDNDKSNDDALKFISDNIKNIENAVTEMYFTYKVDNNLEDLINREGDAVREFLFDHVLLPVDEEYMECDTS